MARTDACVEAKEVPAAKKSDMVKTAGAGEPTQVMPVL